MENKKIKVVIATGIPPLDEQFQHRIQDPRIHFVGVVLSRDEVTNVLTRYEPDVLLLSETLEGPLPTRELILTIRTQFPGTKIIYMLKEENPSMCSFLNLHAIFDIFTQNINPKEIEYALFNPKNFKEIRNENEVMKRGK